MRERYVIMQNPPNDCPSAAPHGRGVSFNDFCESEHGKSEWFRLEIHRSMCMFLY